MGDIRDIVLEVVQAVLPIAILVVVLIMLFVPHWWPVVLQFRKRQILPTFEAR